MVSAYKWFNFAEGFVCGAMKSGSNKNVMANYQGSDCTQVNYKTHFRDDLTTQIHSLHQLP